MFSSKFLKKEDLLKSFLTDTTGVSRLPVGTRFMLQEGWVYGQEKSGASTVRRLPDTAGSLLCVIPAITIPFLQTDLTPALGFGAGGGGVF